MKCSGSILSEETCSLTIVFFDKVAFAVELARSSHHVQRMMRESPEKTLRLFCLPKDLAECLLDQPQYAGLRGQGDDALIGLPNSTLQLLLNPQHTAFAAQCVEERLVDLSTCIGEKEGVEGLSDAVLHLLLTDEGMRIMHESRLTAPELVAAALEDDVLGGRNDALVQCGELGDQGGGPGDQGWNCARCTLHNGSSDSACRVCGSARELLRQDPATRGWNNAPMQLASQGTADGLALGVQGWNCECCTFANASTDNACHMCGLARELDSSMWTCAHCTSKNAATMVFCSMCEVDG